MVARAMALHDILYDHYLRTLRRNVDSDNAEGIVASC